MTDAPQPRSSARLVAAFLIAPGLPTVWTAVVFGLPVWSVTEYYLGAFLFGVPLWLVVGRRRPVSVAECCAGGIISVVPARLGLSLGLGLWWFGPDWTRAIAGEPQEFLFSLVDTCIGSVAGGVLFWLIGLSGARRVSAAAAGTDAHRGWRRVVVGVLLAPLLPAAVLGTVNADPMYLVAGVALAWPPGAAIVTAAYFVLRRLGHLHLFSLGAVGGLVSYLLVLAWFMTVLGEIPHEVWFFARVGALLGVATGVAFWMIALFEPAWRRGPAMRS